jgi:hypothetical protein
VTNSDSVSRRSVAISFSADQNWSSMLILVLWPLMTMDRFAMTEFMTRPSTLLRPTRLWLENAAEDGMAMQESSSGYRSGLHPDVDWGFPRCVGTAWREAKLIADRVW